ncbi:MAG: BACON domain-containing protein [Blastocatellia bacterium]
MQVTASSPFCPRNAVSNSSWLTVTSGNEADGNGPIGYSVAPNHGPVRTGKITLGNGTFTVTQGSGCNYDISPLSKNFDAAGGSGSINVTPSDPGCPRVATPDSNWITITSGSNLTGSGPITYHVAPNAGQARTGLIKVSAREFAVFQAGGCAYMLSPTIFNFQSGNGASSIQVTASSSSCQWSASSNMNWLKITNAGQHTGNGTINFTTDPNPGAARTAKITVGDKSATINQAANSNCTFTISPSNAQVGVGGGDVSVNVTASNSCAWIASSGFSYVSIVSGAVGAGSGVVKLKILPNSGAARTASIAIAGKTFLVNQAGTNGAAAMWITDLRPGFASAGGKEFQMTVKGANFTNGCKVRWNDEERPTTFVNSSTLVATIPASDIADEGSVDVTVAKQNAADETNAEQFMIYGAVANVSSASFKGESLAPASLVSAFGVDLAKELKIADSQPLPTELAGSSVTITDAAGKQHKASLFFVSTGQINYLMPEGMALGKATVMIESGNGHTSVGTVEITQVAPALFSANSNGQGVATALALRVKANGQQVYEQVAQYDAATGVFKARPIDLTVPGEQVYLVFYGTGFRYRNSLNSVSLEMGGVFGNVLYASVTPGFFGLDQINVLAPNSLAGRGEADVVLTVDGKKANTVKLMFK